MENELEVVEGMKLARGYISPYFVTNTKTRECVRKDYKLFFLSTYFPSKVESSDTKWTCLSILQHKLTFF